MNPHQNNLILLLLGLVPISLFFLRWVFFLVGKLSFMILTRNLDKRSKLYHELIEIYRKNELHINLVYTLLGILLVWFLAVILSIFN